MCIRDSKKKRQLSTTPAMTAGGFSFSLGGGGAPSTGGGAAAGNKVVSTSATTVAAMTEEGLMAAELSMAAAAAAAAERDHGLIRTVGRPKRGPCMFTPATATSDETGRRATSTSVRLTWKKGSSGSGGSGGNSGAKTFGPYPRPLWEAEATGGLLGPGETKVLVC